MILCPGKIHLFSSHRPHKILHHILFLIINNVHPETIPPKKQPFKNLKKIFKNRSKLLTLLALKNEHREKEVSKRSIIKIKTRSKYEIRRS